MKLVVASNNNHKVQEFEQLFINAGIPGIELISPKNIVDNTPDIDENGETFIDNAFIKAKEIFRITRKPCFSDDSGLEIDFLNGEPGINSARYAGEHGNDSLNRKKVLTLMQNVDIAQRNARFRCIICYYDGNKPEFFDGVCEGRIIEQEIGDKGFGYDPIFIPNGYNITFAEMSADEKNMISHRAIAVKKFVQFLANLNYEA